MVPVFKVLSHLFEPERADSVSKQRRSSSFCDDEHAGAVDSDDGDELKYSEKRKYVIACIQRGGSFAPTF